ncbi:ATG3/ATG10 family protein [Aspergillus lucknowensis]|uniref:Ubiquitin-like-conjugating enzyme ATG10 n=1 Tax=Aspergillus lucknowensis TaxID=176173 RepID=A0ABR4LJ44_9EURO
MPPSSSPFGRGTLSIFPFLAEDEFEGACRALLDRVHAAGNANPGWSSIRLQRNGPILKISQSFPRGSEDLQNDALAQPLDQQDAQDSRLEACEEDSEALVRTSDTDETLQVDYDIVLSPSYQVPVLYFVLRQADKLLGVDAVYRYLVLDRYRENIKSVGIMGGISFGYHPVSGTPAFFVHPCNTADAMRDIATGRGIISPETYLIVWLGLVGNCLRLHLPSNLFAEDGNLRLESNN